MSPRTYRAWHCERFCSQPPAIHGRGTQTLSTGGAPEPATGHRVTLGVGPWEELREDGRGECCRRPGLGGQPPLLQLLGPVRSLLDVRAPSDEVVERLCVLEEHAVAHHRGVVALQSIVGSPIRHQL